MGIGKTRRENTMAINLENPDAVLMTVENDAILTATLTRFTVPLFFFRPETV